jgi:hypothetical protein
MLSGIGGVEPPNSIAPMGGQIRLKEAIADLK